MHSPAVCPSLLSLLHPSVIHHVCMMQQHRLPMMAGLQRSCETSPLLAMPTRSLGFLASCSFLEYCFARFAFSV